MRRRVRRTLDLCTGSGIHALLAAAHSERVLAVDINPRAAQCARCNAQVAGAKNIEDRPIQDAPVHALVDLAEKVGADLLVVGNVGLHARSAIIGRVFSIPGVVANRAKIDVLIVHTTG